MSKQIWLSPDDNGWKIKQPWNTNATRRNISTKAEAESIMNDIARNQWLETKVQKRNGEIQWGNSYWNDPFPPRDKNRK